LPVCLAVAVTDVVVYTVIVLNAVPTSTSVVVGMIDICLQANSKVACSLAILYV
jgi:hypothetical protein